MHFSNDWAPNHHYNDNWVSSDHQPRSHPNQWSYLLKSDWISQQQTGGNCGHSHSFSNGYSISGSSLMTCQNRVRSLLTICMIMTIVQYIQLLYSSHLPWACYTEMISYDPNTSPRTQWSVAIYSCSNGYVPSSSIVTRTCLSNRVWSGVSITCQCKSVFLFITCQQQM